MNLNCFLEIIAQPFTIAVFFMLADVATGWLAAVKNNNLSSHKMREGLWHKSGFVLLIFLAYGVDVAGGIMVANGYDLGDLVNIGGLTPILICGYIIVAEIVSILENICKINSEICKTPVGALLHTSNSAIEVKSKKGAKNGTSKKTAKSKKQ